MDTRTVFLAIGIALLAFAMLLVVAERPRRTSPMALLAFAYVLMGAGALLQAERPSIPAVMAVVGGNLLAWIGLEYQFWAALALSDRGPTPARRLAVAGATAVVGLVIVALPAAARASLTALVYATLFAATAWAALSWRRAPRRLRGATAAFLLLVSAVYLVRVGLLAAARLPSDPMSQGSVAAQVSGLQYLIIFAGVLSGAFSLILLSKSVTEKRMAELVDETEVLLETLPTGVAITAGGRITRVNPAFARMIGYEVSELEGQPGRVLFSNADDVVASVAPILEELEATGEHQGEFGLRDRFGRVRHTWLQVRAVDWDPQIRHAVFAVTDVTTLKDLQEELARQASYDELTGLLNRRSFLQRADLELSRASRSGRPFALAALDLDRLKMINDGHGHAAGDIALTAVATAFRETFRDIDLTARIGGDEFAVILPDSTLAQANAAMERFLTALGQQDVRVGEFRIELSASVGVAEHQQGETIDVLMARADRAMYSSKHRGGHAVTARRGDLPS